MKRITRTMRRAFEVMPVPLMLLFSGCSDRPEGPVVIGTNVWPGYSNGADAILARPPIKSMGDLAGKRVGVENSALGAYVLDRALQINGLQENDVKTVSLTVDETIRLYNSSNVDAVVSFEPFKAELLNLSAVKIFDNSRIPNEIVDVLVTRNEFSDTHPNALKAVVRGWLTAAKTMKQGSPAVIEEIAVRLKLRPQEVRDALRELKIPLARENEAMLAGTDGQLAQASLKLITVLEKRNGVQFSFRPEDIITAQLLPESHNQ